MIPTMNSWKLGGTIPFEVRAVIEDLQHALDRLQIPCPDVSYYDTSRHDDLLADWFYYLTKLLPFAETGDVDNARRFGFLVHRVMFDRLPKKKRSRKAKRSARPAG